MPNAAMKRVFPAAESNCISLLSAAASCKTATIWVQEIWPYVLQAAVHQRASVVQAVLITQLTQHVWYEVERPMCHLGPGTSS